MSQLQDVIREDLKRLMFDEPQDNIDDIRVNVRHRLVASDSVKIVPLTREVKKDSLFSSDLNKKISKVRPEYIARLVGLVLCGFVFGMMAAISVILVDYPYNLILIPIALAPFVITIVRRMKYGVSSNKREFL